MGKICLENHRRVKREQKDNFKVYGLKIISKSIPIPSSWAWLKGLRSKIIKSQN